MKIIISIAALIGTAAIANANPGIQLKNCVTEKVGDSMIAGAPWMAEIVAEDPSMKTMFIGGLIEGLMVITEEEWAEAASEDLTSLRSEPAATLVERFAYDAMADCSLIGR